MIAFDNPSAYSVVTSAIIFVVCMSILVLIFAPKVLAYYSLQFTGHRNSRDIPLRFSRKGPNSPNASTHSWFAITSQNKMGVGGDRESPSLSDTSAEGLAILSHPKDQETLKEENIALRNKNEELRQCLVAAGVEVVEENSANKNILSSETDPMVRTELRRLQEENEDLKNRLLQISKEDQGKEQSIKTLNFRS